MRQNLSNTITTICLATFAVGAAACGDDTSSSPELFGDSNRSIESRQEAEALAVELLGGRVLTSEEDFERDRDVYEVEIVRASGSVVEIEIEVSTGRVLEVESDSPVVGDDLDVGEGLLTLQEAIAVAIAIQPGTVVAWEIERDEDDVEWEWEIVIRDSQGDETEVEIDAITGDAETDDDGNDDEPWDRDGFDDDDDDDDNDAELPTAIEATALAIVSGSIESFERDDDEGFSKWEIDIRTASGAEVEIELLTTSGRLLEAEGSDGPFDYAFTPAGYLTLAQALAAAGVSPTEIDGWSLDRDEGRMIYDLDVIDGDDIEVDAIEGTVIDS